MSRAYHSPVATVRRAFMTVALMIPVTHPGGVHAQPVQDIRGRWEGRIVYDSVTVHFPLSFSGRGTTRTLALFNGSDSIVSTAVRQSGDSLVVEFAHLATRLRGVVKAGRFSGWYGNPQRRDSAIVEAWPAPRATRAQESVPASRAWPSIAGTWIVPVSTAKGEQAWRFVAQQTGRRVTATMLRVDGDAGALVGQYENDRFVLHHFDGTRPSRLEITEDSAGGLRMLMQTPRGGRVYSAVRPDTARARGIPEPADVSTHTRVRNPEEPFRFAFPDLTGRTISNTDSALRHKVILVNVTGSWCPNCHDEAPFLAELYRRFHDRGLEIVALDFEEPEQLASLTRVRAFVAKYAVPYPYLIAGTPEEATAKIPQAVNLNTWPATFFVGRDGTVRAVRTGFAAKASGVFHRALVEEYESIVRQLLGESPPLPHR